MPGWSNNLIDFLSSGGGLSALVKSRTNTIAPHLFICAVSLIIGPIMKNIELDNRHVEIVYAVLFIGLFAGAFFVTLSFEPPVLSGDPGAAFFPKLICTVSLFFSFILLFQRVLKKRVDSGSSKGKTKLDLPPFLLNFFLVGGLILGMARIGSEISFFAFLFILLGLRTGRWLWAALVAVISTVVIYVVFVALLNVRLPLLFLPQYIQF